VPDRNLLEVAASPRTGRVPPTKSLLLWLRHFLEAEAATRDIPRSFVSYESLLRDWRKALRAISSDLSIEWPLPEDLVAPQVDRFLDVRGRHQVASGRDLEIRPEVSAWVRAAYEWARVAAEGRCPPLGRLDAIRDALSTADVTFLPLLSELTRDRARVEEEGRGLRSELELAREDARILRGSLDEREAAIAQRQDELDHSRAEAAALRARVDEREAAIAQRQDELDHSRAEAAALQARVDEGRAEAAVQQARLDEARARIVALELETARLGKELHEARGGGSAGRRRRPGSSADELQGRREAAAGGAVGPRGEGAGAGADVERVAAASRQHAAATEQVRAHWHRLLLELNRIRTSAAWQLASPLRWARGRWPALIRG
jgi:hypothetical protein